MVKIEIIEERDDHVTVLLKNTDRAFANALRRTLMTDVPKMAIHRVRFETGKRCMEHLNTPDPVGKNGGFFDGSRCSECEKNNGMNHALDGEVVESIGALSDEMIAHRLAMIPIPTFHDEFCLLEDDPGNKGLPREEWGTPKSQIIYHCRAFGNKEGNLLTAGDLDVIGDDNLQIPELYRNIPITKLYTGQFIEFYAYAVLGVGQDHSKWNPVSGVSFSSRKIATIAKPGKAKQLWDLELTIGKSDFSKASKGGTLNDVQKVETLVREMHHVGDGTARIEDFADAITIEDVPGEYLFSFDTDGSMTARIAFEMGCKALSARFTDLSGQLAEDL